MHCFVAKEVSVYRQNVQRIPALQHATQVQRLKVHTKRVGLAV